MSTFVLTTGKVLLGGYDLSGDMHAIALSYGADEAEDTTMGDGTHSVKAGALKTVEAAHEGYWQGGADLVDDVIFNNINSNVLPMTCAATGTEGDTCFFFQSLLSKYTPGGAVGDMFAFSVSAKAGKGTTGSDLIRGTIMVNKAAVITTASGTAYQVGAVATGQKAYAALHVIGASVADTLDVVVQSDDNSGMTSAATRITFAQKAAIGSEYLTDATVSADDWWRITYTIGGASPSFDFVVVLGIL